MGYEVHIRRDAGSPISLDEWCAIVARTEGIRLATHDVLAVNPATGEKITIPVREGDVEVFFPDDEVWIPCLGGPPTASRSDRCPSSVALAGVFGRRWLPSPSSWEPSSSVTMVKSTSDGDRGGASPRCFAPFVESGVQGVR